MGSGIAKQIANAFPPAMLLDQASNKSDPNKLGTISWVFIDQSDLHSIIVINAYTQYNFGKGVQVDYDALTLCFRKVNMIFHKPTLRIGYPMIGAGLGGGDWSRISQIINRELEGRNHTLVEYDGT